MILRIQDKEALLTTVKAVFNLGAASPSLKRPEILGGVYVFSGCAAGAVISEPVCSGVYTGLFNPKP